MCGDEQVLIDDVVNHVIGKLACGPFDLVQLTAGAVKERELWAALNQYPAGGASANRLVVIRNAEKIKSWEQFESWIEDSRRMPTCYALIVSGERDLPYVRDEKGKKGPLPGYIDKHRSQIHLVRCIAPWGGDIRRNNEGKDLFAWAARYVEIAPSDVLALMDYCGGSLTKAKAVLDKAALFEGVVTLPMIKLLATPSPGDDFADALLLMEKQRALLALRSLHADDYSRSIGLLDVQLTTMTKIFKGLARNLTPVEIARDTRLGISHFIAKKFAPAAKYYDPVRVKSCRVTLALHDMHLRAGARVGLMESLVAQW